MSLVIGFFNRDLAMLCGDKRITYKDGSYYENTKKVFKLNDSLLLGYVGDQQEVLDCLSPYLYDDKISGLNQNAELCKNVSFKEMEEIINKNIEKIPNSNILLAGNDNGVIVSKVYEYGVIEDIVPYLSIEDTLPIVMGRPEHKVDLLKFSKFPPVYDNIVSNLKFIFNNVISVGSKYDATINDKSDFVYINRNVRR